MTTTTDPTPTLTDDQTLTAWCAEVVRSHHTSETREWAHYETREIRDLALVEWTIRCLSSTGPSAADHTRRVVEILAERQDLISTYADPSLADEIVSIISPHSTNCQDTDCDWCAEAVCAANEVIAAVAARRANQPPA